MFTEEKAPGELRQTPTDRPIKTLADAIRVGAELVTEDYTWRGCALGTAATALGWRYSGSGYSAAEILGLLKQRFPKVERWRLVAISQLHSRGVSRLKIADMLDRGEL